MTPKIVRESCQNLVVKKSFSFKKLLQTSLILHVLSVVL